MVQARGLEFKLECKCCNAAVVIGIELWGGGGVHDL